VKSGARALGVAESYGGQDDDPGDDDRSVLCGAVVRADRVVEGLGFETCTVGGIDATESVTTLFSSFGRDDVQYVVLSGIAPAWFNVLDLREIHRTVDRPVLSVSFERSPGLESALREHFDGRPLQTRLGRYRDQPPRRELTVNGETVFLRSVGIDADEADRVIRGFTPEGGRPEPLRVARLGARAGRRWQRGAE
jgi:hypothetical protein